MLSIFNDFHIHKEGHQARLFFPVYPAPLPDIFQKIFSQKGIELHFAQQHLFLVKIKELCAGGYLDQFESLF